MAVLSQVSEQFIKELYLGEHDLEGHTIMCALLGPGFDVSFDPSEANHSTYPLLFDKAGDDDEVAEANGYLTGGLELSSAGTPVISVDIVAGEVVVSCDNAVWEAAVGSIGAALAAVVYNASHANTTVICCIEFGATYTTTVGTQLEIDFSNGLTKGVPNPVVI